MSSVLQVIRSCHQKESKPESCRRKLLSGCAGGGAVISRAKGLGSEGTGAGADEKGQRQQRERGRDAGVGWRRGKAGFGVRGEDLEKS